MSSMKSIKYIYKILVLLELALASAFLWRHFTANRTIEQLLTQNIELKSAITNLSNESRIGYAKVLSQETRDGTLYTKLLFVEADPADFTQQILRKEVEIEGDVIHFDTLIVTFSGDLVMDGTERAMYLWRRIYGESTPPNQAFSIEAEGQPSPRYTQLCQKLSIEDRNLFWSEIWALSNNPKRLESLGIKAVYGDAVYRKLQPGLIYIFKVSSTGTLYPEIVPDL